MNDQSLVRFYCLHFQGRSSIQCIEYIVDEHKVHHSGFSIIKNGPCQRDIGGQVERNKKAIHNPQMIVNFVKAKIK